MKDRVESGEQDSFSGVARSVGRLMLIEIRRSHNERLNAIEKEPLKDFGNCVEIRNRSIVGRKRFVKTWLFEKRCDNC